MATWGVVKAQARDLLGIELTDDDVVNVPLLATRPLRQLHPRRERLRAARDRSRPRRHSRDRRRRDWWKATRRRRSARLPSARCAPATRSWTTSRIPPTPFEQPDRRAARWPMPTTVVGVDDGLAGTYDDELLDRALHRRRRPRQREHRPDRRPPHLPCRAQPPGRAHQGRRAQRRRAVARDARGCSRARCISRHVPVTTPGNRRAAVGRRAPVPGGEVRHRDAVPAPGVRGVRAQDAAAVDVFLAPAASTPRSIRRSSPSSRTRSIASATRC